MFERTLVPLDGSRAAEAALPAARLVARAFDSTLILAHVVEERPPRSVHGEPHLAGAVDAAAYLSGLAAGLAGEGLRVETHVHEGGEREVASSIAAHSSELGFDLAVMAVHGRHGVLERLSASLPLAVAAKGCFAVYLARRSGDDGSRPSSILVPLDGDPSHEAALPHAASLARALGLPVELLAVVPRRGTDSGGSDASFARFSPALSGASLELEAETTEAYLESVACRLRTEGIEADYRLERGRPVRRILRRATARGALLVLSTHRKLGVDAALEGCVAFQAASAYAGDILVVPVASCR